MQPQTPEAPEQINPQGGEQRPSPTSPEVPDIDKKVEQKPITKEAAPRLKGDQANQNVGAPTVSLPQPITKDEPQQTTVTDEDDIPDVAGDVDLIEKEWVKKAKTVVENTKEDPHKQNEELNNVKVGYLKKRYNKEVKKTEE